MILFLPTGIYIFLTEIVSAPKNGVGFIILRFSAVPAIVLLNPIFVSGYYRYFSALS
jgi:hypothetical protein